jgi:hypothetical protein
LDTRDKIVSVAQLRGRLDDGAWLAVAGTFDPLTLSHAERMAELSARGKPVLAVVEPGTNCLLPVEARAVLVAARRSVRLVVIAEADALASFPQLEIVKDEEGERQRSLAFVEHVRGRQTAK